MPFENVERFDRLMRKAGNVCKLLVFEGRQHGFFNVPGFKKGTKEDFTAIMEGATFNGNIQNDPIGSAGMAVVYPKAGATKATVGVQATRPVSASIPIPAGSGGRISASIRI